MSPEIKKQAKKLFRAKREAHGDSWKAMSLHYIADRMMVKLRRINLIVAGNMPQVDEGIPTELLDIINYAIIGLMRIKQEREGLEEADILYEECVEGIPVTHHKSKDMQDSSLLTQIKANLLRILNT